MEKHLKISILERLMNVSASFADLIQTLKEWEERPDWIQDCLDICGKSLNIIGELVQKA